MNHKVCAVHCTRFKQKMDRWFKDTNFLGSKTGRGFEKSASLNLMF